MADITSNDFRRSRIGMGTAYLIQAICALGGIALAIIGLSNVSPALVLGIAAIVLGIGMLAGGGVFAAQQTSGFSTSTMDQTSVEEFVGGGMAFESLAGIVGIVLGILALSGVVPATMLPTAAIVFGVAMLFSAASAEHVDTVEAGYRSSGVLSGLSNLLGGAAAITLGILALSRFNLWNLTLIAYLCVGAASLVSLVSVVSIFSMFRGRSTGFREPL